MGPAAVPDSGVDALYRELAAHHNEPAYLIQVAGKLIVEQGDTARGALVLDSLPQADAGTPAARLLLAQARLLEGGTAGVHEAVSLCRAALETASTSQARCSMRRSVAVGRGTLARGVELSQQQRDKCRAEGVKLLHLCVEEQPSALHSYNLALLLAELGKADEATQHARTALQRASAEEKAAAVALTPDAAATAATASTVPPAAVAPSELQTYTLVLIALLLSARQQLPAATGVLAAAAPSSSVSSSSMQGADVLVAIVKARLQAAQGDLPGAIATMAASKKRVQRARSHAVTSKAAVRLTQVGTLSTQIWLELAVIFSDHGGHDDALFCVDQGLSAWPWRAESHHVLGVCHAAAGHSAAAAEAFNTALSLSPTHTPTLLAYGTLLRQLGSPSDLVQARELLGSVLRNDPTNPLGWYQMGLTAKAQDDRVDAERHLYTAVQLSGSAPVMAYASLPLLLM